MATQLLNNAQEAAVRTLARESVREYQNLDKRAQNCVLTRRNVINKHYAKLHGAIKRSLFIHYVGIESGVISDD